jgi:dihydropteroate synthase
VSVDTRKPMVAQACFELGAHLVNDVSGLGEEMLRVAQAFGASGVVMHMQGTPETMQQAPAYDDVLQEVGAFLAERLAAARFAGVPVLLDPGIGFGKRLADNLSLIARFDELRNLGAPVLLGASRKSFLGKLVPRGVDERLAASLATGLWAGAHGADMVRVHDVAQHVDARTVWRALGEVRGQALRGAAVAAHRGQSPRNSSGPVVFVEELEISCRIGVPAEERAAAQPVRCSFTLSCPGDEWAADDIAGTADYARAVECVVAAAGSGERQLLETLQRDLERALENEFPGWQARVAVDKPVVAQALGAARVGVRRAGLP